MKELGKLCHKRKQCIFYKTPACHIDAYHYWDHCDVYEPSSPPLPPGNNKERE